MEIVQFAGICMYLLTFILVRTVELDWHIDNISASMTGRTSPISGIPVSIYPWFICQKDSLVNEPRFWMHIFSIVFFSVLFSVNSKFVNLNLFRSLDDLKLNKMVGQNGVFNQQGSILQMALKQNGEHDKALNSFSKARFLPWFAITRISANNLPIQIWKMESAIVWRLQQKKNRLMQMIVFLCCLIMITFGAEYSN